MAARTLLLLPLLLVLLPGSCQGSDAYDVYDYEYSYGDVELDYNAGEPRKREEEREHLQVASHVADTGSSSIGGGSAPKPLDATNLLLTDILRGHDATESGLDSVPKVPCKPEFSDDQLEAVSGSSPTAPGYVVVGEPAEAPQHLTADTHSTTLEDLRVQAERERLKGLRAFAEAEEERKCAEALRAEYYKALLKKMQQE